MHHDVVFDILIALSMLGSADMVFSSVSVISSSHRVRSVKL
jgi:hypothetical protein